MALRAQMKRLTARAGAAGLVTAAATLAAAASPTLAANSSQASGLSQLTIAMNGSSISVSGALQSGAVDVVSTTTGEPQGQPLLVRLNPGVTPEQAYAFGGSPAARDLNNVSHIGSIVFDAEADPGVSHAQTSLEPGQYVALDLGGPHPATAPHTAFTIAQSAQPATLPAPQATVRAIEFGFRAPRTLHDGQLVQFENDGFLVHMTVATRERSAKVARQLVAALRAGNDKRAKRLSTGGTTFTNVVSPGALVQLTISAKPGYWVLACFMTTQDGREDTRLGMERIVHVTR